MLGPTDIDQPILLASSLPFVLWSFCSRSPQARTSALDSTVWSHDKIPALTLPFPEVQFVPLNSISLDDCKAAQSISVSHVQHSVLANWITGTPDRLTQWILLVLGPGPHNL